MHFLTVQLPAHATIFDRAQCLRHPHDNYVCYKNRPGHYKIKKSISTGNKLWQSWMTKAGRKASQSWFIQPNATLEKRIQLCCFLGLLESYWVNHWTQTFHRKLLISHISPPFPKLDIGNVRHQDTQNLEFPWNMKFQWSLDSKCE